MERLWQGGSGLTHFCGLFWALDVFLVEPLFSLCFMCLCHLGLIHCVCVFGPAYCSRMCCLERLFKNFFVATFLMQVPCFLLALPPCSGSSSFFSITLLISPFLGFLFLSHSLPLFISGPLSTLYLPLFSFFPFPFSFRLPLIFHN